MHCFYKQYTLEQILRMTVAHVYWLFDAMGAHLRLTNPFGSGDESSTSGAATSGGQTNVIEHKSGFALWSRLNGDPIQRRKVGIDQFKSIDEVRAKNPHLADFLSQIKKGEFD